MRVCTVCQEPVPPGMPVCPLDGGAAEDPDEGVDSLTGSMIGEYRVKGIVGEGGMGQVYEGLQPVIGKRVAIKLLRRELATNKVEAQRLLDEARSVNAIGHRGIIDIFSFGALPDGRQYFVMEYLSGVSLSQHLRTHGALPVEDTLKLLDEMLAGLGAAHGAGVIHRDLKPSNIFLVSQPDGSSFVKLLDFGIAKQAPTARGDTPQTRVSQVMGTPEFMAPEQARGQSVGPRTDLYALGVVAFEMLTGEHLFDADNPYEIVNMHLSKQPRAPSALRSDVPPEVDSLVLSLLEKDPQDRPANAEVVREQLKKLRKTLQFNATRLAVTPGSMTHVSLEGVPSSVATPARSPPVDQRPLRASNTRQAPVTVVKLNAPAATRILDGRGRLPPPPARPPPPPPATIALDVPRDAPPVELEAPPLEELQPAERRAMLVGGVVLLVMVALIGGGLWLLFRKPPEVAVEPPVQEQLAEPVVAPEVEPAPIEVAKVEPAKAEPPPPEPAKVEPPPVEPVKVDARPLKPAKPKVDPATARYRRIQAAWDKARSTRSAEDRRIFDVMLKEVQKQLEGGSSSDATETLNDFVSGALNGKEP
ncbi:MAG: serine/threonine-protein kinase [Archangium sp.]|nr:serine/threonine-protein kinase [Archangium sp.]